MKIRTFFYIQLNRHCERAFQLAKQSSIEDNNA